MSLDTKIDLNVDLGEDGGGIHEFHTVGDLFNWITSEHREWAWLNEAARHIHSNISSVFNTTFNGLLNNIQELVTIEKVEVSRIEPFKEQITKRLNTAFNPNNADGIIYSKSTKGKFVHQLAQDNPHEVASALLYLTGRETQSRQHQSHTVNEISGVIKAVLFDCGIFGKKKAAQESFGLFLKKWDEQFGNQHEEVATLIENLEGQKNDTEEFESNRKEFFENQKEECDKLNKDYKESFQEVFDKVEGELQAMRNAVDSDLRLRQPTEYWERKSEDHAKLTKKYQNWALGVGIIGFGIVAGTGAYILRAPTEGIPWRSLVFMILLTSVYIYGLRVIIKLFFSNHHLMNDAQERVVMTRTYMSLVRGDDKGGFLKEDHLPIVLAALFRPAQKGLVDEPNAPVTPIEIASDLVQRGRKL